MKKHALVPILGILLLAPAPSTVHGQELFVGSIIRVGASQSTGTERGWTEGSLVRLTSDTLWYQSDGSVSAMSLVNAEIRRATDRNRRWAGLGIGAAAGGAIGALVALVNFEPTEKLSLSCSILFFVCSDELVDPLVDPIVPVNSRAEEAVTGAIVGALTGGGLGYVVGMLLGRWETVELDQVMVGAGNLAVSMSIRR